MRNQALFALFLACAVSLSVPGDGIPGCTGH